MWDAKHLCLLFLLMISLSARAQFVDDFSDGDFTRDPEWFGQTDRFIIDNERLRLNASAVAATSYLTTNSLAIENGVWEFFVRLDFNPSSTNLARVYLVADNPDLTQSLNGYFVRIGGTEDEVSLYRQTGSTITKIIDGEDKRIDFNLVEVKIKVTRDDEGNWELFSDVNASGNYNQEGLTIKDETHLSSTYFGVSCIYTQTRSTHFYFDDFVVTGTPVTDKFPPEVTQIEIVDANSLRIIFNEEVEVISATSTSNYVLSDGLGTAQSVSLEENNTQAIVQFGASFPNGKLLTLTINGVEDLSGNAMNNYQTTFRYFVPEPAEWKDIIISEFFPDPDPIVGLPNQEFVEIYNRSNKVFNLLNWKLIDPGANGTLNELYFFPGDYLILATNSGAPLFASFGQTMGIIGMPILSNNGDILTLRDPDGNLIDSLSYDLTWYQDNNKRDGGWTIEVIDIDNFCTDRENYRASINDSGGTPGSQNSVFDIINDEQGPKLQQVLLDDLNTLLLKFDERLTSTSLFAEITFDPEQQIESRRFTSTLRDQIEIKLVNPLEYGDTYQLKINNAFDCKTNVIDPEFSSIEIFVEASPPTIEELQVIDENHLLILFSETIDESTAMIKSNYFVSDGIGGPTNVLLSNNNKTVELFFLQSFTNGKTYTIDIWGVMGLYNNEITPAQKSFVFFVPVIAKRKDIIITELFPDPTPPVGLPEYEFVEIYNRSSHPFDLTGWRLVDPGANGTLSFHLIQPGEYVILASAASSVHYAQFGTVLTVQNMPILSNAADQIYLVSPEGLTIDSVSYQLSWYRDNEKRDGGWTLELIDLHDVCRDAENWSASEDPSGGTPGRVNSINDHRPDLIGPKLLQVIAINNTQLLLKFNEKLSDATPNEISIQISENMIVNELHFYDQSKTQLLLTLTSNIQPSKMYSIEVADVFDCPGNEIQQAYRSATFVLTEEAKPGDVVINELLFNPRPGGVDFVEIYNNTEKYFNLKNWQVGNYVDDNPTNLRMITTEDELLSPGAFKIFTSNIDILKGDYPQTKIDAAHVVGLPSYPDREGTVSLVNDSDVLLDYFIYHENFHNPMLKSKEGVSLERVSAAAPTNLSANWKSAASIAGFATPGYLNSSARGKVDIEESSIKIEPEVFIPQYGIEDFTRIIYSFKQAGLSANVFVIDQQGRKVRTIANNELLNQEGFLTWDGSDDSGTRVRTGPYLIFFQLFNTTGELQTIRKRVVVASRF